MSRGIELPGLFQQGVAFGAGREFGGLGSRVLGHFLPFIGRLVGAFGHGVLRDEERHYIQRANRRFII